MSDPVPRKHGDRSRSDATATGISPPQTPPPKKPDDPQTPSTNEPKKLACKIDPKVDCPDGYYCSLVAENTGECLPIR